MNARLKKAAALKYKQGIDAAPKVVAKGSGWIADKIIEIARAQGIPIREDKNLVEILASLDLNEDIPAELYKAVAEILAFVYKMSGRLQG